MSSKMREMFGMYAMMAAMGTDMYNKPTEDFVEEHNNKKSMKKQRENPVEIIPKGQFPFDYDGEIIYAMNQRVADKKARKRGLIK